MIFWTLPVLLQCWLFTCLVCAHTLTARENRVRNILKSSEKNTIFNEHPVSLLFNFSSFWHYGIKFRIFEYRTIYISVNRSMFIMTFIPLELLFFYLSVSNDWARHKGITSLCLVSHMFELATLSQAWWAVFWRRGTTCPLCPPVRPFVLLLCGGSPMAPRSTFFQWRNKLVIIEAEEDDRE